jgi:glycosyltransferase involved in cell wall biosynthesis
MIPAVFGIIAAKFWRKRTIITYHGGEAKEYFCKHASFVRRWLTRADEVIVLSGFLKEIFDQYNIPCVVIPNIVVLRPQTERTGTIAPKFISIRHLEPLYNIPCVLEAYEQILKQYPEATLDILGQGSMRAELEAYVQEHSLTGVKFIGHVPNDKIYDYLNKADIMLSAARIDNMPVSLLEAMNAGLLVIASRVGGVPFMIEDGKTGLLFESKNANDLASKMTWALEHPEQVNTMIINAQIDVQKYSWEKVKEQLFEVYN